MSPIKRTEVIGDCTLYLGDCLEVLPLLGRVDAVVTDPPYGVGKKYASFDDTPEKAAAVANAVLAQSRQISLRVVMFTGMQMMWDLPKADWVCAWAWVSTGSYGKVGVNQWQPLLFYGRDVPGFGAVNGIIKGDFKYFNDGIGSGFLAEKVDHPCPKIPKVMDWCVRRFSAADETVLDPFMGSGTTGVACVKLGRKFIGIEIDEGYFDIACERIRKAYAQPDMFVQRAPEPVQEALL